MVCAEHVAMVPYRLVMVSLPQLKLQERKQPVYIGMVVCQIAGFVYTTRHCYIKHMAVM